MIRILQISEYKFKFFTLYFNIIGLQQSLIDLIGPNYPYLRHNGWAMSS